MPKKAFLNLPPETQAGILEKAMPLYVDYPYETVTLQMLLDALSLHPTVFYRYFTDKDELYIYANLVLLEKYTAYRRKQNPEYDLNVFVVYEDTEPLTELELAFLKTFTMVPQDILLRSYWDVFKPGLFNRYKQALRRYRAEGKLYADIDDDLISYMYATTMFNMLLFFREFNIDDPALQMQLKKSFYTGFFRRGIIRGAEDCVSEASPVSDSIEEDLSSGTSL